MDILNSKTILLFSFFLLMLNSHAVNYRWLEETNDQTLSVQKQEWMQKQYQLKTEYFSKVNFEPLKQKLFEPFHKDVPLRQMKLRNGQVLSLYIEAGTIQQKLKLDDVVIFDETKINKETENFSSFSVDPLQKYLVIPVYSNGSTDEYTLYVLSIETGNVLQKFSQTAIHSYFWKKPHHFTYILGSGLERFHVSFDFEKGFTYFEGEPQQMRSAVDNTFLTGNVNELVGEEWKNFLTIKSFGKEEVYKVPLDGKWLAPKRKTPFGLILESYDSFSPIIGFLPYRYDFDGTVNFGEVKWHTLETQGSMTASFQNSGYFLYETLFGVDIKYHLFSPEGELLQVLKAPINGSLAAIELKDKRTLVFKFRSPVKTKYEFELNLSENNWDPKLIDDSLMIDENGVQFKTTYFGVDTTDNLQVPVRMVNRADISLDQTAKLFVEAYGGHGGIANFKPSFSRSTYLFLKAGGVHIAPAVRGGGEYGRGWHEAGKYLNKLNTYIDIEKTVEFLHAQGVGTAETTGLMGWSSGGMMAAAVMTRRPDLFKLVVPGNGLTDLMRKEILDLRFDRGWSNEYGGHHKPEDVAFLESYSPLIFAQKEREYPTVYVVAGDGDSRVNPIHSYKFVSALQDHQKGQNPILLGQAFGCGHWPNSAAYMGLKGFYVNFELYGVIFHELGLDPEVLNKSTTEFQSAENIKSFGESLYEELQQKQVEYKKRYFPKEKN
ncbi:MAG: prolyl oligopeptidase family serine peptidase [Halobacteriovoraceae bacterium]|nr:prolyl oligopeptidase family serine peptidase [Halobacteriovoraceae bacterium]